MRSLPDDIDRVCGEGSAEWKKYFVLVVWSMLWMVAMLCVESTEVAELFFHGGLFRIVQNILDSWQPDAGYLVGANLASLRPARIEVAKADVEMLGRFILAFYPAARSLGASCFVVKADKRRIARAPPGNRDVGANALPY